MSLIYQAWGYIQWVFNQWIPDQVNSMSNAGKL
jgi:hypothetical protein